MIPLTESLKMAFSSILRTRQDPGNSILDVDERAYVNKFLTDNCPAFKVSNEEIALLFRSFYRKRFYKKKKVRPEQLYLYGR